MYRILQEGLNNVVRHANRRGVGACALRTGTDGDGDRGPRPGLPAERRMGGIGLIGMRERAELLGGHIDFERPAEGGTRVNLRVPLPAGEKA